MSPVGPPSEKCTRPRSTVALRAAHLTDGLVDPTIGRTLVEIGYDRDFVLVAPDGPALDLRLPLAPAWREVELDPASTSVSLPDGVCLDLGATAKALCADRSAARAHVASGRPVLVSLGGDLAVAGPAPAGGWVVHVTDDHRTEALQDDAGQNIIVRGRGPRDLRRHRPTLAARWPHPTPHRRSPHQRARSGRLAHGERGRRRVRRRQHRQHGVRHPGHRRPRVAPRPRSPGPPRRRARPGHDHRRLARADRRRRRRWVQVSADVSTEALWWLTRGTGLVSLVLLTLVLVLGIAQVQRWAPRRWPTFVVGALHRNASLLAVVFLGVHIASAVVDSYAPIPWAAAVFPFTSDYRPIWLGLGAIAFDLIVALIVTSLIRARLSYRTWKIVHWAAYACWPIAFVHGLGTGSDGTTWWVLAIDLMSLAAIVAAIAWRLITSGQVQVNRRVLAASGTALTVLVVVAWALTGPAQPGWARRAGTPDALLGSPDPTAGDAAGPAIPDTVATPAVPFTEPFSGSLSESTGGSEATVTVQGDLEGPTTGTVAVTLTGRSSPGGGLRLRTGTVTIDTSTDAASHQGTVTGLQGTRIDAAMVWNGLNVNVTVQIDGDGSPGPTTGTVSVTPSGPTR